MQPLLARKASSVRIQLAFFVSCCSVDHIDDEMSKFWSRSCWEYAPRINFRGGVCHFLFREARVAAKEILGVAEGRSLRGGPVTSSGLMQRLVVMCRCDVRNSMIHPASVVDGCILLAFAWFPRA